MKSPTLQKSSAQSAQVHLQQLNLLAEDVLSNEGFEY
jgi:hypothetical protein